jgi:glyoxylase-like metal-dependent hydrolase (beta-lactamase superfamily II)
MLWNAHEDTVPRKAAAAIVLDPQGQVLLARRNASLRFMGGHHVFPGGALHAEDSAAWVLHAPSPEEGAALCAGVRELFEESGLLCTGMAHDVPPERLRSLRRALLAGEMRFPGVLEELGLRIAADAFTPAGLWITPPFSPIRFHTRYFIHQYQGPRCEEPAAPDGEIIGLDWLSPREARRRWQAGAIKLSVPVAFALQHLAARPLPQVLDWMRRTPDDLGGRPHRFELRRGVHVVPLATATLPPATHTNAVVIGEEELLLFDPGPHSEAEQAALFEHLDHLLALGERLIAIVLTHSHPDHTGAVGAVAARYGAPVWAHAATAAQVDFRVDRLLGDEERIEVPGDPGWRLRCLHTPGHDPGHLCFHEETTGTLLAGDLIANPGTIVVSPHYGGDMTDYLASLERLLPLEFRLLIPAHGAPLWGRECKPAIEDLMRHRRAREQKILDALRAGARTYEEILALAYADTPVEAWPLARHQIDAHLRRLGVDLGESH